MIFTVCQAGFRAVEKRVAARQRALLAANHESCADWVPEIPEPMFRQLIQDGLLRTAALCGVMAALVVAWAFSPPSEIAVAKIVIGLGAVSLYVLINWRKLTTQCVDREFLYRRLNGKWRWER